MNTIWNYIAILEQAKGNNSEAIIINPCLKSGGQIHHMNSIKLLGQIQYSKLSIGKRSCSSFKKRYKDELKWQ